jgi:FMN phosphatase YigB (HAD superfamily)
MIILDFDGVLINSLDEVVLTSFNAANETLHTALTEVPPDLVRLFKRNRFHVQSIGGAIPLMNWCIDNYQTVAGKTLSLDEYQAIIDKSEVSLADRTHLIYATRRRFIDTDENAWFDLHQPYQPVWNELVRRKSRQNIILTNKNRDATLRLCRRFGFKVEDRHVYTGDQGAGKTENMDHIMQRYGAETYCFIDDSVKNLRDLDDHFNKPDKRITLLLAAWGYSGPDDATYARTLGYSVYEQEDLVRDFMKKGG